LGDWVEADYPYAAFNASRGTSYKDRIEERYHFSDQLLKPAQMSVGKRIVYYEPRRADKGRGRNVYFATARVLKVVPDDETGLSDHYFALVDQFLPFQRPVPLRRSDGTYWESRIKHPSSAKGLLQNSVRGLPAQDFAHIVIAGLGELFDQSKAALHDLDDALRDPETGELLRLPPGERERRVEQYLVNRPVRDAMFRLNVREAYGYRCAVTGLEIRNGGGRPEVHAAHIWAVEDGGPDMVQNGIALSQTFHWMFDRGLIGLRDDYSLILSHNKVPPELRGLIGVRERRIILPEDRALHPDPYFLAKHRAKHCL
jgi:putative restriction endonuclease